MNKPTARYIVVNRESRQRWFRKFFFVVDTSCNWITGPYFDEAAAIATADHFNAGDA